MANTRGYRTATGDDTADVATWMDRLGQDVALDVDVLEQNVNATALTATEAAKAAAKAALTAESARLTVATLDGENLAAVVQEAQEASEAATAAAAAAIGSTEAQVTGVLVNPASTARTTLAKAYAAGENGHRYANIGTPQHEDGTKYTYPNLLNFGATTAPPMARPAPSKGVDFLAHWYNDFGLDSVALAANSSNGWYGWYDWSWNFPTNTGNGTTTLGYDPARHPIQGFYKGDDANVLDWQCYWMAEAGVTALAITQSEGFTSTNWSSPSSMSYWMYQLFNNVPNFKSMKYTLSLKCSGTTAAIEAQNNDLVAIYAAHPGAYTYTENAKTYAVVTAWDLEQLRGAYDNYNGQTATAAYLVALAAKFKAIGYDGVMILARVSGVIGLTPSSTLKPAGAYVVPSEYEATYPPAEGYGGSYANYANNVVFPTGTNKVINVVTSHKTAWPHGTGWTEAGTTPALFRKVLNKAVNSVIKNKQKRIITIYNVSEWAEGGPGLIPQKLDGFGYLDALKSVATVQRPALDPAQINQDGLTNRKDWSLWKKTGITVAANTSLAVDVSGATTLYSYLDSLSNYSIQATLGYTGTAPVLGLTVLVSPASFGDQRLWVRIYNPNTTEVTGLTVNLEVRRIYP